jgi:hypothetical protein
MNIKGTLSPWIGTLLTLKTLDLWGNALSGVLPIELGGLKNLESFSFFGNEFTGVIPDRICNQAKLNGLYPCYPHYDKILGRVCGDLTHVPECVVNPNKFPKLNGTKAWLGDLAVQYKVY